MSKRRPGSTSLHSYEKRSFESALGILAFFIFGAGLITGFALGALFF